MRRSCCFVSSMRVTGSAEVTPLTVQWRPLARKLPARRPLSTGCAASDSDVHPVQPTRPGSDYNRSAGAAAADAVFRHLDASLDDEDDEGIYYGQGEKGEKAVLRKPLQLG